MNTKIVLVLAFVAMVVMASGCVSELPSNESDPTDDPTDQVSENQIINSLDGGIIDESNEIDIGELI